MFVCHSHNNGNPDNGQLDWIPAYGGNDNYHYTNTALSFFRRSL